MSTSDEPVTDLLYGVDYSYINGRCVVERGRLTTLELPPLIETVNRMSAAMVQA